MKHFNLHSLRGVIVLAGLLLGSVMSAQHIEKTTPDVVGLDALRLKQADACIDKAIREGRTPGAVLAVVRHGKIGYLKAYGQRQTLPSPLPMTENTIDGHNDGCHATIGARKASTKRPCAAVFASFSELER